MIEAFRNGAGRFLSPDRVSDLERFASACQPIRYSSQPVLRDDAERDRLEQLLGEQSLSPESFTAEGPRRAARCSACAVRQRPLARRDRGGGTSGLLAIPGAKVSPGALAGSSLSVHLAAQLLNLPGQTGRGRKQDEADCEIDRCLAACLQEVPLHTFPPATSTTPPSSLTFGSERMTSGRDFGTTFVSRPSVADRRTPCRWVRATGTSPSSSPTRLPGRTH